MHNQSAVTFSLAEPTLLLHLTASVLTGGSQHATRWEPTYEKVRTMYTPNTARSLSSGSCTSHARPPNEWTLSKDARPIEPRQAPTTYQREVSSPHIARQLIQLFHKPSMVPDTAAGSPCHLLHHSCQLQDRSRDTAWRIRYATEKVMDKRPFVVASVVKIIELLLAL